jgi:hypothetical protein
MKNLILVKACKVELGGSTRIKIVLTCNGMKDAHFVAGHVKSFPKTLLYGVAVQKN